MKEVNYTEEQVARMEAVYTENPTRETVDQLAEEMGKGVRSVIAKLSNMGVYVVPERTTKAGKPIVKKDTIVSAIGEAMGAEVPSLAKANKADLEKLAAFVASVTEQLED